MDERAYLIDIAKELIGFIGTGSTASESAPYRNPTQGYIDADHFELEKQKLFRETPQLVCFSSDMPNPGDYKTFDDTGVPILITRDQHGEIHAFLNACAHRGMRLKEDQGNAKLLTCIYHAWSFGLDGKLKNINEEHTFGDIDKTCYNLIELSAQEKYGLIFVAASPHADIDIDDILGDLTGIFKEWRLNTLQHVNDHTFKTKANWKVALDTFCEGYHFGSLHKDSVGDYSLSNCSAYHRFGPNLQNHRIAFPNMWIKDLIGKHETDWGDVNELFNCFQLVHFIYPNVSLLISPRACEFFRIYPGAHVGEQITHYSSYWRGHIDKESEENKKEAEEHFNFIVKVVDEEDYWVGNSIQKNLNTNMMPYTTFGRNEPALINMHKAFRRGISVEEKEAPLKNLI